MSYVIAAPEYVAAAATDLANIGSALGDANAAALVPTTGAFIPAGADAVSMELAALFGAHAEAFQAISARAAAFHDQFVQLMNFGSQSYALSEAANVSNIQTGLVDMPQQAFGPTVLTEGVHPAPQPQWRHRRWLSVRQQPDRWARRWHRRWCRWDRP